MAFQTVFKRYELKYLLTLEQKERVLAAMEPYMAIDRYGRSTIRNIYFDTDNYRLIRRSIEKPMYKEKLRIRSYEQATKDSTVFVELKKKYDKVVFKRRLPLSESDAMRWVNREIPCPVQTQISREIDYFIDFYGGLRPTVFLSYEREAYFEKNGGDFRVSFDDHILCRQEDVLLTSPVYGESLLQEGIVMMELKCSGGIPLWMTEVLSAERTYKTSFSKYGTAYERMIFPRIYQKQSSKIELEKENLRSNLESLRCQINPHFFMNTLNNIHALIDIDKEKAQKCVHEFSKMMRYVLYDTSVAYVPLEKEISFLRGYIDLMRLRYTDKLEIKTSFASDADGVYVPPMLFLQFVENAFKHGVTYKKKSIIDISLQLDEANGMVVFTCRNTKPETPATPFLVEQGGIGVENARKRLELLFGKKATLRIDSDSDWYNVELKMPVQYDKVYNS